MFKPRPLGLRGGHWSDRHGVIERDPTLALSGPLLDPGDIAAHGAVEKHGAQTPALGQRRAEVQHSRPPEQVGPLRRQTVADAAAGNHISSCYLHLLGILWSETHEGFNHALDTGDCSHVTKMLSFERRVTQAERAKTQAVRASSAAWLDWRANLVFFGRGVAPVAA